MMQGDCGYVFITLNKMKYIFLSGQTRSRSTVFVSFSVFFFWRARAVTADIIRCRDVTLSGGCSSTRASASQPSVAVWLRVGPFEDSRAPAARQCAGTGDGGWRAVVEEGGGCEKGASILGMLSIGCLPQIIRAGRICVGDLVRSCNP